jgi:galactose-1-phosphate uridylyltransferase
MAYFCDYGNELSNSIKLWEFIDFPNDFSLLKNDSAPLS